MTPTQQTDCHKKAVTLSPGILGDSLHPNPRAVRIALLLSAVILISATPVFSAKTSLIRLEDLLANAEVTAPDKDVDAFKEISYHFNKGKGKWISSIAVAELSAGDGILSLRGSTRMALKSPSDIKVPAEDIEEIRFRARTTDVDSVQFRWYRETGYGSKVVRLIPDGKFHEYMVSTNLLEDWTGDIRFMMFAADGLSEEYAFDLDFLRLLYHTELAGDALSVKRVWGGKTLRSAIHLFTPSILTFDLKLPDDARFTFATKVRSERRPIRLEVKVNADGDSKIVYDETHANADRWTDHLVDLSEWSGERIQLEISVEGVKMRDILYLANALIYTPDEDHPNVIVYLIDALRPDHMGVYGYHRDTTPNMDGLLDHAVVFERAYATAPRTVESVPAIMTSTPSTVHGVREHGARMSEEKPLLQDIIRQNGYATASFITNVSAGPKSRLDRGFDYLHDAIASMHARKAKRTLPEEIYPWLEKNHDKPFFIYVHTAEPHAPYGAAEPFEFMYATGDVGTAVIPPKSEGAASDEEILQAIDLYDGEVRFADDSFGTLVAKLHELDVYDKTIILVMADHGEEFYEHGMSKHSLQLYNETIRIPFVFFGKKLKGTPARTKAPVSSLDVMPTVLGLLEIEGPEVMFGTNLFDSRRLAPPDFDRPIMAENFKRKYAAKALIHGDWKLIRWDSGRDSPRFELYNIARDYGEKDPVDDRRKLREMRRLMRDILDAYSAMETPMDMPEEIDVETMEKLRSLGYID